MDVRWYRQVNELARDAGWLRGVMAAHPLVTGVWILHRRLGTGAGVLVVLGRRRPATALVNRLAKTPARFLIPARPAPAQQVGARA